MCPCGAPPRTAPQGQAIWQRIRRAWTWNVFQMIGTPESVLDKAMRGPTATRYCALRHHLHANQIGGVHAAWRLQRQYCLQRRNRDRQLVEAWLPRGEQLQLQARPHDRFDPAPVAVAPRELDDLEGDAGDDRHTEYARGDEQIPSGQADGSEHEERGATDG